MRDIQTPGGSGINSRPIIPAEQAKRYVAPPSQLSQNKREYFQPQKNNSKKFLALGLFLSLLLISVIFFLATFAFDGATITLKPIKKETGLNETYIVSELDRKDLMQTKVQAVTEKITVPKRSVKKVFKKAEGDVFLYNNFSKETQKFVKGTRLATSDGKIFKLTVTVTVPGKNGATASTIKVHVQADTEGVEYNVGPTKFTIPGLKASPKYKDFYAESTTTMKGGTSGNSNEVGDADLQKGIQDMKQKLIVSVQEKVGSDIPEGFNYNKDNLVLVTSKIAKISEDDVTATYEQSATGTTLLFKKEEIVKRILEKQNGNDFSKPMVKVLNTDKLEINVSNAAESLNVNSQITLTITGPAPAVYYPNKQAILEYYAGRNVSDFNDITKKFPFIDSAKRVIYPFWNTRFPSSVAKIKVEFEE